MSVSQIPFYFLLAHLFQGYLPQDVLSLNNSVFAILIKNLLETTLSKPVFDGFCVLGSTIEN